MSDDNLKATESKGSPLNNKHTEQNTTLSTAENKFNNYSLLLNEIKRINNRQNKFKRYIDRMSIVQIILLVLVTGDLIITGILIYLLI